MEMDSDGGSTYGCQDDQNWEDWQEEEDAVKSLFTDALFPTAVAAMDHDKEAHGFDIRQYKTQARQEPLSS